MNDRSWLDVKAMVIEEFVNEYNGVYDERPIDAARTMFQHGMSGSQIFIAMAQIWNAAYDEVEADGKVKLDESD